jgi:trehalose 6-phosphate synthase/phosphatase
VTGRLLLVSNRLPVTINMKSGRPVVTPSVGGLATGLREPHERCGGLWVGWPGVPQPADEETRRELERRLQALRLVPVPLSATEVSTFYERISNGVLWPICHDRLDKLPLRVQGWDVYERVNARFADAVAAHYRPGDMIWVHDYQLMRLPALLRERIPEARIGYFHHIPFPHPEIFAALSRRRWLLRGLLGADLIGFHTRRYRGHFALALRRLLGVDAHDDVAMVHGRRVRLGVFPMGIDARGFAERAAAPEVKSEVERLRGAGKVRLLVGIDRLDYSKGIPRRLHAVEALLESRPEWRERVRLVQIAVPSRGGVHAYQRFRRQVEALVGRINGTFGTPSWTPIQYVHRGVSDKMLLALYRAADVMLVTPVRDGMNLVAKEFVASRTDDDGVLVLSEFAGAADELTDALLVNPYDVESMARAVHRALIMPEDERQARMRGMRAQVLGHHVQRWASSFIEALEAA